jgi:hypothetical protein
MYCGFNIFLFLLALDLDAKKLDAAVGIANCIN